MQDFLSYFRGIDPDTKLVLFQVLRIAGILVAAWVLQALATRFVRIFRSYMERRMGGEELARINTLTRVFRNAAAIVIVIVAGMLVLGELGISIAPILATAGVAGIAVGFGAQSLIKDYFNGIFLLLDDQVRVGDVVNVAGYGGLVEEVTLRFVRLRNFDGHVHFVPNGEIKAVTNLTRNFATAVIEVGIGYKEDPDEAFAVMADVAKAMRAEPDWRERMMEDLEIIGVERLADFGVILRGRLRVVPPIQQWNVKREFIKRLKAAYDARGIEFAVPRQTLYAGRNKDGSLPALRVVTSAQ